MICRGGYFSTTTKKDCNDSEIGKDSSIPHKLKKDIETSNSKFFKYRKVSGMVLNEKKRKDLISMLKDNNKSFDSGKGIDFATANVCTLMDLKGVTYCYYLLQKGHF